MKHPSLQKLIVQFLALSVLASSGVLLTSTLYEKSQTQKPPIVEKQSSSPQNGFAENVSGSAFRSTPNLTSGFAEAIAKALIEQNPEGPQMVAGELGITAPDMNALIDQYVAKNKSGVKKFSADVEKEKIKVQKSYSQADVLTYLQRSKEIADRAENSSRTENLIAQPASEQALLAASLLLGEAEDALYALPVPKPLQKYHEKLIATFTIQRAFGKTLLEDPIHAAVLQPKVDALLKQQIKEFDAERARLQKSGPLSGSRGLVEKIAVKVFGIETAYAIVPVFDAPHTATTWYHIAQVIYQWFIKIAKAWLQNRLMKEITNMMVAWATGGSYKFGDSFKTNQNFIKDWKSFLTGTFNQAAGDFINKLAPQLCQGNLGALVTLDLQTTYYADTRPPVVCTLDQVVGNLQDFANDFRTGGWLKYSQTYLPAGNYQGSLWFGSQLVEKVAQDAQDAKKSEAESSGGYKGKKKSKCADGTAVDNEGTCGNGEKAVEETTIPGSTTKGVVSSALEAPIHRIANADTWEALAVSLLDSLTTKLIANGDDGFSNDSYLSGQPADPAKFCSSYAAGTPEYKECILNATNPPIETGELPPDAFDIPTGPGEETCNAPVWHDSEGGEPGSPAGVEQAESFIPTPDENNKILSVVPEMGPGKNYVKAQADFDVTIGPKDPAKPAGMHEIFNLQRSTVDNYVWGQNTVAWLVLRWGENGNKLRFGHSINREVGGPCLDIAEDQFNPETTFLEGETYHFRIVYDVLDGPQGSVTVTARDNTGKIVASTAQDRTANVLQSNRWDRNRPSGFIAAMGGGNDLPDHPEAHTFGWKYENLKVTFTPGNGRPAGQ